MFLYRLKRNQVKTIFCVILSTNFHRPKKKRATPMNTPREKEQTFKEVERVHVKRNYGYAAAEKRLFDK